MSRVNLKALSEEELAGYLSDKGLPPYRAGQVLQWIYARSVEDINSITVLSKPLRQELEGEAYISSLELLDRQVSADGTEKYLFGLEDSMNIESVLIPDEDKYTLCVSSQVGCAMGCGFCRTATMGFKRNLKAFEIVDQLIAARRLNPEKHITNIVFMGMGEPLMNIDNVVEAVDRLNSLMEISRRRITVSTSGLADRLDRLAKELEKRDLYVNLAISLNATTDEQRSRVMPVNDKHSIKELMNAVRKYPLPKTRKITFEYVLIGGLNDSRDDAGRLARLIRGIANKVNIIPLNPVEGSGLLAPERSRVHEFKRWLEAEGVTALVRKSKGGDILASCGQLASGRNK